MTIAVDWNGKQQFKQTNEQTWNLVPKIKFVSASCRNEQKHKILHTSKDGGQYVLTRSVIISTPWHFSNLPQ